MIDKYIYGSDVVFLCYDVTDPSSFADLGDWHELVRRARSKGDKNSCSKTYLVGNKIDLNHLRKVTEEKHKSFATSAHMDGDFFVSAQNGDRVLKSFYEVAASTVGITMTEYELAFTDRVIAASVVQGADEGRIGIRKVMETQGAIATDESQLTVHWV